MTTKRDFQNFLENAPRERMFKDLLTRKVSDSRAQAILRRGSEVVTYSVPISTYALLATVRFSDHKSTLRDETIDDHLKCSYDSNVDESERVANVQGLYHLRELGVFQDNLEHWNNPNAKSPAFLFPNMDGVVLEYQD